MALSLEMPPKAKPSEAKSSVPCSSCASPGAPVPTPPVSGVRRSTAAARLAPDVAARRLHALVQGAEVAALAAERVRLEASDFGDLTALPVAQLLVFLSGAGNDDNDLLLELLAGLEHDLERAHLAAANEATFGGDFPVDWPTMLRSIRSRARVVRELRRREIVANEVQRWAASDDTFADARELFDEGHLQLCEMLTMLNKGLVGDVDALRATYNLARSAVATTPPNADAQALVDARGLAVEIGRRLDRLQRREHSHAEDVALLASAPTLSQGAA